MNQKTRSFSATPNESGFGLPRDDAAMPRLARWCIAHRGRVVVAWVAVAVLATFLAGSVGNRGDDDRGPRCLQCKRQARAGVAPGPLELAAGVRGGMSDRKRLLDELRPVAFAIAYLMFASVSEAEGVVQEALLRVRQALDAGEQVASLRAFVATVTTRLAISELHSARARGERHVGEWLPEPIITNGHDDPPLLLDVNRRLVEHARNASVDIGLDIFPEQQHTFHMSAGHAPEADEAIRRLAHWSRPKLGLV